MPDGTARLSTVNRAALAALCLVLAGAVGTRVYLHGQIPGADGRTAYDGPVDLGGVLLPRSKATSRAVWIRSCDAPAAVDFVPPASPGGDAPSDADGRTSYVYRGRLLDGHLAPLGLNTLHYLHRALGLVRIAGRTSPDELAVKVVVPAGCGASVEDVVAALRREVRRTAEDRSR